MDDWTIRVQAKAEDKTILPGIEILIIFLQPHNSVLLTPNTEAKYYLEIQQSIKKNVYEM